MDVRVITLRYQEELQGFPEEALEEARRPLYRDLKRWRKERARAEGKPAYAVARNAQLAEITRRVPRSVAELKEIDGIGEAFCRDYGAEVLGLMPDVTVPAPEKTETDGDGGDIAGADDERATPGAEVVEGG